MTTRLNRFFTAIRNDTIGLLVFIGLWAVASLFFPPYILPSPLVVGWEMPFLFNQTFLYQLAITLYRLGVGFGLALVMGSMLGITAFSLNLTSTLNSLMMALQVLPGIIVAVIFLLMFGLGNGTPIALVAFLTMPTIAINTANGLAKINLPLKQFLISAGGGQRALLRYLYLPALVPTLQSNLTIGLGLSVKVVVLGEFIGSQDGLGYLLNVAHIYFKMKEVFFYLFIILLVTVLCQMVQNGVFTIWLEKYFYPE